MGVSPLFTIKQSATDSTERKAPRPDRGRSLLPNPRGGGRDRQVVSCRRRQARRGIEAVRGRPSPRHDLARSASVFVGWRTTHGGLRLGEIRVVGRGVSVVDVLGASGRRDERGTAGRPGMARVAGSASSSTQRARPTRGEPSISRVGRSSARHAPAQTRELLVEWEACADYMRLAAQIGRRDYWNRVAPTTFRREALVWASDRDPADIVLRRTRALLAGLEDNR